MVRNRFPPRPFGEGEPRKSYCTSQCLSILSNGGTVPVIFLPVCSPFPTEKTILPAEFPGKKNASLRLPVPIRKDSGKEDPMGHKKFPRLFRPGFPNKKRTGPRPIPFVQLLPFYASGRHWDSSIAMRISSPYSPVDASRTASRRTPSRTKPAA